MMRHYLSNRFVLLAIFAIAIGLTAKFNWGWLVAAGIAPLLLSVGPCIAMCALGLCMGGMKSKPNNASANELKTLDTDLPNKKDHKGCC